MSLLTLIFGVGAVFCCMFCVMYFAISINNNNQNGGFWGSKDGYSYRPSAGK